MTRENLPTRRGAEAVTFAHENRHWTATFSRFENGQVAEIFLDTKPSPLADMAQDAAILASIALQHGAPLATVRHAIADRGGPLAAALALIGDATADSAVASTAADLPVHFQQNGAP